MSPLGSQMIASYHCPWPSNLSPLCSFWPMAGRTSWAFLTMLWSCCTPKAQITLDMATFTGDLTMVGGPRRCQTQPGEASLAKLCRRPGFANDAEKPMGYQESVAGSALAPHFRAAPHPCSAPCWLGRAASWNFTGFIWTDWVMIGLLGQH